MSFIFLFSLSFVLSPLQASFFSIVSRKRNAVCSLFTKSSSNCRTRSVRSNTLARSSMKRSPAAWRLCFGRMGSSRWTVTSRIAVPRRDAKFSYKNPSTTCARFAAYACRRTVTCWRPCSGSLTLAFASTTIRWACGLISCRSTNQATNQQQQLTSPLLHGCCSSINPLGTFELIDVWWDWHAD